MQALSTVCPVFFMLGLGFFAKAKKLVSKDQENGLKSVLFGLLFPIMVFNALFTTTFQSSYIFVILFVFLLHCTGLIVGKVTGKLIAGKYAHVAQYLLCTVDGGNAVYPLYATIVGSAYIGNIVLLDIACMFVVFLLIPVLLNMKSGESTDIKGMLKSVFTSVTVIAVLAGLILSLLGVYNWLSGTQYIDIYTNIISNVTSPIAPLVLFTLGYDFEMDKNSIAPLFKTIFARLAVMICGIFIFLHLFPNLVADKVFYLAIVLYFVCPPAFVLPGTLEPIYKNDEDRGFASAFISLHMLISVILYTFIVVFIA